MKLLGTTIFKDEDVQYIVNGRTVIAKVSLAENETISAIARCHDDDEFDEKFGKRIAKMRLEQKVLILTTERLDSLLREFKKHLREAESNIANIKKKRDKKRESIQKILQNKYPKVVDIR